MLLDYAINGSSGVLSGTFEFNVNLICMAHAFEDEDLLSINPQSDSSVIVVLLKINCPWED